jgi:methyl-galactoside transport system substrate-binding protein
MLSLIIVSILSMYCVKNNVCASSNITVKTPINVAVFLNDFNDQFISSVQKNFEDIQIENENKILNLVSTNIDQFEGVLNKIVQKNIPLILYYAKTQPIVNFIKSYRNAVIIDTDINQPGILQCKILVHALKANKEVLDKNKNNIMQYVMLKGHSNSPETIARTKYSIQTIN